MAKQGSKALTFIAWLTGVIVSLAVGFGMVDGVLAIRWIPTIITNIFGWIVVITTVISAVMAIMKH